MAEADDKFITTQEKTPTIYMDLDGTLAEYDGWKGVNHIGDPLPGAKEFLATLKAAGARIVLYTARLNTNLNVEDWKELTGTENTRQHLAAITRIIKVWLVKHGVWDYIDQIAAGKPTWWVLLDDRCIRFGGDFEQALKDIFSFKPWGQQGRPNPLASDEVLSDPSGEALLKHIKSKGGK